MAFVAGYNAQVLYHGIYINPYLTSASLSLDVDTTETTAMTGASAKTYVATLHGATLSLAGRFDPDIDDDFATLIALDPGVATFCPGGGRAIGDRAWMFNSDSTNYTPSGDVADLVGFSWDLLSTGRVAAGDVIHPGGEDTNTTAGAAKDDGAATSTGCTLVVHVQLVDAGSWTIKLQDSAIGDFSDVADVSGMTTSAITSGGAQRIVSSSPTAAVRRYIRYAATRTGGSAGDGITFFAAYARH